MPAPAMPIVAAIAVVAVVKWAVIPCATEEYPTVIERIMAIARTCIIGAVTGIIMN